MQYATYNPKNLPLDDLPTIYGFNNGGDPGWMYAQLLSSTGYGMGSHLCSAEHYMPGDLGIIEGSRPDRHEGFQKAFPDGYKMEFVPSSEFHNHAGLQAALKLAKELMEKSGAEDATTEDPQ